jgi:hypothetical protein
VIEKLQKEEPDQVSSVVTQSISSSTSYGPKLCRHYNCPYCKQVFNTRQKLKFHVKSSHSNIKTFYCGACVLFLASAEEKTKHFEQNHRANKYKCMYCRKTFNYSSGMHGHIKKIHLDVMIACDFKRCQVYFLTQLEKLEHLKKFHNDGVKCKFCNLFCKKVWIRRHLKSFHSSVAKVCKYSRCYEHFHSIDDLKKHDHEVHANVSEKWQSEKQDHSQSLVHSNIATMETAMSKPTHQMCRQEFRNKSRLTSHTSISHRNMDLFSCTSCYLYFSTRKEKIEHLKKYHWSKPNKCVYCIKRFSYFGDLKLHVKNSHLDLMLITCPVRFCNMIFKSDLEKKKHFEDVHKNRFKTTCKFCNLHLFSDKLHRHVIRFHSSAAKWCIYDQCFKCFTSDKEREEHYFEEHGNEAEKSVALMQKIEKQVDPSTICPFCKQVFLSKCRLRIHISSSHPDMETFLCSVCRIYFSSNSEKLEHFKKLHRGKNLSCIYCTQKFNYSSSLYRHIRDWHLDIMIKCDLKSCQVYFLTETEKQKHFEQMHKNVPMMQCEFCFLWFTDSRNKSKHSKRCRLKTCDSKKDVL